MSLESYSKVYGVDALDNDDIGNVHTLTSTNKICNSAAAPEIDVA